MRTQRVRNLVNEFMTYHNEGYSINEIADFFDLHFTTVYANLEEIAQKNGVSRESLLVHPHTISSSHIPFKREKIDTDILISKFNLLSEEIDELISLTDTLL